MAAVLLNLGLRDFEPTKLLPDRRPAIRLHQLLKLHAFVHVEDTLFVALIVGLLLDLLLHRGNLHVSLGQYLLCQFKLLSKLQNEVGVRFTSIVLHFFIHLPVILWFICFVIFKKFLN